MDFDFQWLLLGLPLFFILGWAGSRLDLRQLKRERRDSPKAYYKGLSLLLNEQQDKAIDAFIEAVQSDPDTSELHFALGNLFRRRGEFERAVRVHQHLLDRGGLPASDRERAQHALAQDFVKAGLFDRAEQAYRALEGTAWHTEARMALLNLFERSRDWRAALETAQQLEGSGTGSFGRRISHYWCELSAAADQQGRKDEAERALQQALKADPSSARPWVMQGERWAKAGQPAEAMEAWNELRLRNPSSFTLVASDYADAALACGRAEAARAVFEALLADAPRLDFLAAWAKVEPDYETVANRYRQMLHAHPTLSAAREVLQQPAIAATAAAVGPFAEQSLSDVRGAVTRAASPLQRYRCA
ncbi:MAG TPA: tetratricopeptide repeat protein, partial [Burkholderiaceae bacterium]|nr:tetratricopeptide repeat protein [Burkholderiaceae bacterium]